MALRGGVRFAAGAAPPIALLLFYQWQSFGSPWYPGQHYMPPVDWIEIGYQGVAWPTRELFGLLLLDPRFGLFITCPLLALGVIGAVRGFAGRSAVPRRETIALFGFTVALVVFLSAVQYTRLQWVTGIRYILPVVPPMFLLAWPVLHRLWRRPRFVLVVLAFAQAWCLAMTPRMSSIPSLRYFPEVFSCLG